MADDGDPTNPRPVLLLGEGAAERGLDAEHLEELGRDVAPGEALGLALSREVVAAGPRGGHQLERGLLLAPVEEVGVRDRHLRNLLAGLREADEAFGVFVW